MNIKAALFDIDGTLLDTNEFVLQAFEHTVKTHHIPHVTREDILKIVGPGLNEAYRLLAPEFDDDMLFDTHADFQLKNTHMVKAFPTTKQVLTILRDNNIKIAAVTNRSHKSLGKSLNHIGIEHFFDHIVAYEDVIHAKPDPEGIFKALSSFNIQPQHAVMVGDTAVDVQAGKAAGVKTIGVTTGFYEKERLLKEDPTHIIHDLNELIPLVLI